MADAFTGFAGKAAWKLYGPRPGIHIVRFWQGIVEIALRATVIVLSFAAFVSACAATADLEGSGAANYRSAAGWAIFIAIVVFIVEGVVITVRFLNFSVVNNYSFIFLIIDACISGFFALSFFIGAIAAAVYAGQWGKANTSGLGSLDRLEADFGALAAFGFFSAFAFVGLAVWMVLFVVVKWNDRLKYNAATAAVSDAI